MDLEAFGHYLSELAGADRFSGVVAIERGGERVFTASHGFASRAWQVPCTPEIRFDTASITKLFTAVAVLQLVQSGQLDLGCSVVGFLGLEGTAISPDVTPYHLLTHTSGIADDADEEAGERFEDLFVERPNYSIRRTADYLPLFAHKPPNFPPGKGTRYCNCGYNLLGLMVEKATGQPYRDRVTERVFGPAGMADSGFFRMDVVTPRLAEGADPVSDDPSAGWRRNIYSYPPIGDPAGGAYVTVADLLAFRRALLAGTLLDAPLGRAMLSPHEDYRPRGKGMHRTGFGFEFDVAADGAVRAYWKEGINAGTSGILQHYPAADLTVALLSNTEDGAWPPLRRLNALLLPS